MAGSLVSGYSLGDSDPFNLTKLMESSVWQRKGFIGVALTNYYNQTLPAIAAGSTVEVDGGLFKFASEEAITGSPSDGLTYITVVPSGSSITAAFTNTAPTWDDSKMGYYGTGGGANNRYVAQMIKATADYKVKQIYYNQDLKIYDHVRAYVGSSATPGTTGTIPYDTITHDDYGNFNTGTFRFVSVASGYYSVNAQVSVSFSTPIGGTGAFISVLIKKNGSSTYSTGRNEIDTTYDVLSSVIAALSDVIYLDAGEYIDFDWESSHSVAPGQGTTVSFITVDRIPF